MGWIIGASVIVGASLWASPMLGADIAVDVESGEILFETEPDAPRLPASLAKLMTAYVAFEAMAMDEVDDSQLFPVSRFAARQPPVKLGLAVGGKVPFSEMLAAAVVGSKNDAAVFVAEAVSGSESAFVIKMNETARQLGMTNTVFANATGLPAPGQRTTARDIALLSRALLTRFPKKAALFSKRSVSATGESVRTTNPLFGRVPGAQGLKTGFTCAAGYAISALVERDGRRIIAVTLGHKTKSKRLSAVKGLIEAAFAVPGSGAPLKPGPVYAATVPNVRACNATRESVASTDLSPEELALYAAELARAKRRVSERNRQVVPPPPNENSTNSTSSVPPPLRGWAVFLGAYENDQTARSAIRALLLKVGQRGIGRTERRAKDGMRLAIVHSLNQKAATAICRAIDRYCVVLPPARLLNPRARWRR